MKNKLLFMLALVALMTLSCNKMELIKSEKDLSISGLDSPLKDGLLVPSCKFADAVVSKITITSVDGNIFKYKFVVANIGGSTLFLNRMYFQTYISTDAVLDPSDPVAGGSIFGDTAPALTYGQTYTQSWYYNPTVPENLTKYHYVIVQLLVRPKFTMPECFTANNIGVEDIGCNLAEAIISNINITNVSATANTFDYTFTVTNTGWGTLYLDRMLFQTYVSKDAVLGAGDKPAGGSIFDSAVPALAKGESYSQNWYYHPTTPEDLTEYKYLIIQLSVWNGTMPECSTDNNTAAQRIIIDIPRNGLIAFYPFSGNANDVTGNNLHGTVNGAALSVDRFGYGSSSYSFDGVDDFITMGNPALLQISNTITVSGWLNVRAFRTPPSPGHSAMYAVSKIYFDPNVGGNPRKGYTLAQDFFGGGAPSMAAAVYSSNASSNVTSFLSSYVGNSVAAQEWIFFCMVIDGTNFKYYHNGVLVNDLTQPATLLDNGSLGNLNLGTYGGGFLFNGWIDDVAIYNRALSATEVQQVLNQNISQ
jgi:Concanavalin A-like lectin/glucanases superfamily